MMGIIKSNYKSFLLRGAISMGGGPIVLAIVYLVLGFSGSATSLSVGEVALGIITVSALAFIAGAITVVYQIEELPLLCAIIIHGSVLYLIYAVVYLLNGWVKIEPVPFLIFTLSFIVGYVIIWVIIYLTTMSSTKKLNQIKYSD